MNSYPDSNGNVTCEFMIMKIIHDMNSNKMTRNAQMQDTTGSHAAMGGLPQGMILAALHTLASRSPLKLAHLGRPAWAGLGFASRTELETVHCACCRLCCLPSQVDRQLHNKE